MNWLLSQIAQAVGWPPDRRRPGPSFPACRPILGPSAPGQLFIALAGERFDAHDFLDAGESRPGPLRCWWRTRQECRPVSPAVVVDDTRLALGRLAAAWRASFTLPVIAVTGSNGKTTTKEMIAAILKGRFRCCRAVDARQPEQRHRPAADAARPARLAPRRGDRDGHESPGRDRLSGTDRRADGGADHQRPARPPRRHGRSGRSGARKRQPFSAACRPTAWP
jgi:hypothetical protein